MLIYFVVTFVGCGAILSANGSVHPIILNNNSIITNIAKRYGKSENYVSVSLNRIRKKLHDYLIERGFEL